MRKPFFRIFYTSKKGLFKRDNHKELVKLQSKLIETGETAPKSQETEAKYVLNYENYIVL